MKIRVPEWVTGSSAALTKQTSMNTMNKTIDEKPIKPYLVTLKVNSKKPYKNSEASVKVVKDGKRYKLVGNFKLKKPQIVALVGRWGPQPLRLKVRAIPAPNSISNALVSDKSAKSLCDVMTEPKMMWDYA